MISHSVWYNMSRMKTGYARIWVCGAVIEEASHESGGHDATLREKMRDLQLDDRDVWVAGWWGLS
jgi:hypothetical protein